MFLETTRFTVLSIHVLVFRQRKVEQTIPPGPNNNFFSFTDLPLSSRSPFLLLPSLRSSESIHQDAISRNYGGSYRPRLSPRFKRQCSRRSRYSTYPSPSEPFEPPSKTGRTYFRCYYSLESSVQYEPRKQLERRHFDFFEFDEPVRDGGFTSSETRLYLRSRVFQLVQDVSELQDSSTGESRSGE